MAYQFCYSKHSTINNIMYILVCAIDAFKVRIYSIPIVPFQIYFLFLMG